jgi:hypothetical protein
LACSGRRDRPIHQSTNSSLEGPCQTQEWLTDGGRRLSRSTSLRPPVSTFALFGLLKTTSSPSLLKQTHQEGTARMPGHNDSCTGHYTAHQNTLPRSTPPRNCNGLKRYYLPGVFGPLTAHPAVHHRSRTTRGLTTTLQPGSTPQPTPLGKAQ